MQKSNLLTLNCIWKITTYNFIEYNKKTNNKKSNIYKMLQTGPNITPPFEISVALYTSKTRKAHQGSLLNLQVAPKWIQKDHTYTAL